ncbi:lactosylceramide 4-alpha-galactosyltransferase-like [Sitodiplosis mosellana]|uniref:lactosylceramide 4-alpha-galactosyltransferase-like n=1 Tax=Sitodiplosis mosellana TaxID=263140 RepID=UPI00244399B6|nr:lactosylceramide 4-alpha-galactosyltransferase-like [Sitodiplosis mosellana]
MYSLEDIMKSPPKHARTIFFHHTTCARDKNGTVTFTARQACSIESAAKLNINQDVFVLFAAQVGSLSNNPTSPIFKALTSYPNIYLRSVNWYNYAIHTPAQEWVKRDIILTSPYYVAHLSDFIRLVTLYKYGGIHFDLDFIIQKSLDDMPANFAGAEQSDVISNAVFGIESNYIGHKIIEMILREHTQYYKPRELLPHGSGSITRVMQKICHRKKTLEMMPEFCWGFKVFPERTFFPIPRWSWRQYFDTNATALNETLHQIKESVAVHFWNSFSQYRNVMKSEPRNVYRFLAEQFCPKVFQASGPYF